MKMIRAVIRPETEERVVKSLERIGIYAMTKIPVTGRGRQGGVLAGSISYVELAKVMLMICVADEQLDGAITTIGEAAYTGHPGDGRVFVSHVEKTVRLRTGDIAGDIHEEAVGAAT